MHIVLVGVNHKSAPIELRERLAFGKEALPSALSRLRTEAGLHEAAILSTCNRVELYAAVPELNGTVSRLQQFLGAHGNVDAASLSARLYSLTDAQSVRHLFSVASGLDSMLLGEDEIAHQVKRAYEAAKLHGTAGKVFHSLFQRALNTAKAVRSQTAIGRGATSIGAVAVELADKIFGQLSAANVLLVGAGKIGEATLRRLADRGVQQITILNRSPDRAREMAALHGGDPAPMESLPDQLTRADIVITSTSAPEAILTRDAAAAAMRQRHQRSLCIVDLGVPRNVDPAVSGLENVYLFNIDDLQGVIAQSQQERQKALCASQAIVDAKVERFLAWWLGEGMPECSSRSRSERAAAR